MTDRRLSNESCGPLETLELSVQGVEPYAVKTLLNLIQETAQRHGLTVVGTDCTVHVAVEFHERSSDFEAFRKSLGSQFVFFGVERQE